ncbi:PfkB family carbohydrate kinase [Xenorhabdus sp. PB30.3]|uniref:PfkB family carbohydrate kinase n=1 Tax=Xenorhabdus sp. PB30.3 TaxID=2788941 RepID=UPI001E370814|nr:PfkB family carbohydrate kinase [Xenorhabdus sp. PB30.3]MCC8382019.1 winged helix-turn-helix transcriptional regulator [Xenorhabdus sp. PB30.3]
MDNQELKILQMLRRDPFLTQNDIAAMLEISRSSVAGHIMNLQKKGHIKGRGYIFSSGNYAVTVGASNMDITSFTSTELLKKDSNPGKTKYTLGGVGRNIAHNIATLKNESYLISVFGDDSHGKRLFRETRAVGVDLAHSHKLNDERTSTYHSIIGSNGELQNAVSDMDIVKQLTPELLIQSQSLIERAGILIIDCNLTENTLEWLLKHSGNTPVFVDPVSSYKAGIIRNWLSYIHTIKPNRLEAEELSGIKIDSIENARLATSWFHEQGVHRVVLSMGAEGVYYSERDYVSGHSPAIPVNIVNTTGSGDAMIAGLVHCGLAGMDFQDSVKFSQCCAAQILSSEATYSLTLSPLSVEKLLLMNSFE